MKRLPYTAEGKPTVYAEVDSDGVAHAPDGFRFPNGYTSEDHSAPLIPLRRGYVIQSDGPHGWRQFHRWSDDTGEGLRLAAYRLWRRTGYQTQILRYPVSRVEGVFPWGDMTLVQDWGSRRSRDEAEVCAARLNAAGDEDETDRMIETYQDEIEDWSSRRYQRGTR